MVDNHMINLNFMFVCFVCHVKDKNGSKRICEILGQTLDARVRMLN